MTFFTRSCILSIEKEVSGYPVKGGIYMCGRYTFSETVPCEELEKIIASVQRSKPAFLQTSAEINPGDTAPIYFYKEKKIHLSLMPWGFRNPWKKGVIINARAETAASKQIFSPSLHSRRCVIPSAGFYEWSREKQKYFYTLSGSPLYLSLIHILSPAAPLCIAWKRPTTAKIYIWFILAKRETSRLLSTPISLVV